MCLGGSCYLSSPRLLKLRSNTTSLEAGGKWHTHTQKTKKRKNPKQFWSATCIRETMEPQNWCKELLDWPIWYRAEEFPKCFHIQTVLFVSHTVPSSGRQNWASGNLSTFNTSYCMAVRSSGWKCSAFYTPEGELKEHLARHLTLKDLLIMWIRSTSDRNTASEI